MADTKRVNVGLQRAVHQAMTSVLQPQETIKEFIEGCILAAVRARRWGKATEEAMAEPVTATEASMDLRREQEIQRNKDNPRPPSELDELKEQVRKLTALMTRDGPILVDPETMQPIREERTEISNLHNQAEMVIDWNLVPSNVPDGARLITEADDDAQPGVCVQFWRLPNGQSLKTSTNGSVMIPAEEPGPGGPKQSGNAPSTGLPADRAGFDGSLNTPEASGPLSPILPARTARAAVVQQGEGETDADAPVPLVSPKAYINAHGRKVRPSDPTRSQVSRIHMLNDMVDGARLGSNAPKQAEAAAARPSPAQPGNPTPPTRPARRPAPAPAKPVPRASFE